MTTTVSTDDLTEVDAEQEAREADRLVAALEERVREGDDSVSPAQITAQRELAGFARLRAEAVRRKAARDRAADEQARRDEAAGQVRAMAQGPDGGLSRERMSTAFDTAVAALQALAEANAVRTAAIGQARSVIVGAGLTIARDGIEAEPNGSGLLVDGPTAYSGAGAANLLAAALVAALPGGERQRVAQPITSAPARVGLQTVIGRDAAARLGVA